MRLHRFYLNEKIGSQKELVLNSKELVHQIRRVFRFKKGDLLTVFDGSGNDYVCSINEFEGESRVSLVIRESEKSRFMSERDIYLIASVVKKDKFETIAEKATELGVTHIMPLISERSEKKALNTVRLNKIITEASEQSGRGNIPTLHGQKIFTEIIDFMETNKDMTHLVFHTEAGESVIDARRSVSLRDGSIAVYIGPEGGWSDDELALFHRAGAQIICLGKQILRAETAVISALSQVVF